MISIGDVCPLFFKPLKYKYSNAGCFRQVFSLSDNILLQIFCDNGEIPLASLNDKIGNISSSIALLTYDVNESVKMYYASLSPSEGIYTVTIGDKECEEFCVCENNIFWIDDVQQMFQFRIIGGFKPDGVDLKVENEQFVNQKQEIIEMYSLPYKTFDFVFGTSRGVPYYIAEFINKLLCLSHVNIDGNLYVREGDSVPEKLDTIGKKQMFIYKVTLRPRENDIAGIGGKTEIATSSSGIAFLLTNPEEDDVLKYKKAQAAFVNENYV